MAEQVTMAESSRVYALLPPEAWFKVLEYLEPVDLIKLKLVRIFPPVWKIYLVVNILD
jgi:hypothetical protein